jgi:hypothetical protein
MVVAPEAATPARRAAVGGTVAGLALTKLMEKRLGFLGQPYERDEAGKFGRLAKGLAAAGAAVVGLAGKRSRTAAVAGGALLLAGELSLRFSVYKAGFQSAKNPLYTVVPQRERAERRNGKASTAYARP